MTAFKPCAIIPVYDHPVPVVSVVKQLRDFNLPVILVDDGSGAECAAVLDALAANNPEVHLLRLMVNSGKGAAVMKGLRAALAQGFSHALQIDADGQHDANAVPDALALAREQPQALVLGVPVFDASIPRLRLSGRWLTHVFVWLNTWSFSIRDAMCGFRVYPLRPTVALADRHQMSERMDFDIEIAVRLVWANLSVLSVPVAVRYPADGISHFDLWRDNLLISRIHARLMLGMLLRAPMLLGRLLNSTVRG